MTFTDFTLRFFCCSYCKSSQGVFSYINPQRQTSVRSMLSWCLWVFSYIKPQPSTCTTCSSAGCLWVFSYIKPQQNQCTILCTVGVYGSFPTSNHNIVREFIDICRVFMGLFLHQTTTALMIFARSRRVFMGLFLHQTTTLCRKINGTSWCLWVFSYIKPQLAARTR